MVSTVGRDEVLIRDYIRKQEHEDARLDQLGLWRCAATDTVAQNREGRVRDPA